MDWLEILNKMLPTKQIYKDLAQPAVKEVGEVLQKTLKVARFAVFPIDYLAAQHQIWLNYLERLAAKVPEENLIEAVPEVAGPIFDGLKYIREENILSELFLNLLARAIDKERVNEAHPAFVQIIKELSPDEGIILFYISKNTYQVKISSSCAPEQTKYSHRKIVENEFPLDKLLYPENFWLYMDHLVSLNLGGIKCNGKVEPHMDGDKQKKAGQVEEGYTELTRFGQMFVKACAPKSIDEYVNKG